MRVCLAGFLGLYRPIRVGLSVFELSVILEYFYHTHRTIYEAHYNPPKTIRQGLCQKQRESNERFIVSKQQINEKTSLTYAQLGITYLFKKY